MILAPIIGFRGSSPWSFDPTFLACGGPVPHGGCMAGEDSSPHGGRDVKTEEEEGAPNDLTYSH